ncbi:MAG TPA: hypothetical protein VGT03_02350 [Candidatus Acidoferrales bacterium]|nr:hypothetical protein [Candidatus Acidoferrales bacterium]
MSSTTASLAIRASTAPQRTYRIPISTGIFDHYPEIGEALWLLLFYIDKTTEERPAPNGKFTGIVLGGRPVRDAEVAEAFNCPLKAVRRWRSRLEYHGLIRARRTPFGHVVEVVNSQKWHVRGGDKPVQTRVPETGRGLPRTGSGVPQTGRPLLRNEAGCARSGKYKEDKTGIDSIRHRQQIAAKAAVQNAKQPSRNSAACSPINRRPERIGDVNTAANENGLVPISEILAIIRKARAEFEAKHGK